MGYKVIRFYFCLSVTIYINYSCQTYEGGFSGCPGLEAHGGYAFCGLASLVLLQKGHLCDVQALLVIHAFLAVFTTIHLSCNFRGGL